MFEEFEKNKKKVFLSSTPLTEQPSLGSYLGV